MLNILKRLRQLLFKNKKRCIYVVSITTPRNTENSVTKYVEFKSAKKANAFVEHIYRHMQRLNMRYCDINVETKEL